MLSRYVATMIGSSCNKSIIVSLRITEERSAAFALDVKYTGLCEAICRSVVGGSVECHRKLREIFMVELARATEGSGSAAACRLSVKTVVKVVT